MNAQDEVDLICEEIAKMFLSAKLAPLEIVSILNKLQGDMIDVACEHHNDLVNYMKSQK